MVKAYAADSLNAIEQRQTSPRDFLSITVRDRDTNDPIVGNFWSGIGDRDVAVYNPKTGVNEIRTFEGAGMLIEIDPIPLVANLTVQQISITFSSLSNDALNLIHGYNAKQAEVLIWRGWWDRRSDAPMTAAAEPRFLGYVQEPEFVIPAADDEAGAILRVECSSIAQQLTMSNPETRSDASQRRRDANDAFLSDVASVGEWEQWWGQERGTIETDNRPSLSELFE